MKGDYTKAKEITPKTKENVLKRQNNKSISGVHLTRSVEFHHHIPRSAGGVGYEWNIVAITHDEHRALTDGQAICINGKPYYSCNEFKTLIRNHLLLNYQNWSEENCKYKKWKSESEYGVKRNEGKPYC